MKVRYIRESMNGNNENAFCHWVEIQAINYESTNIALNKKATCVGGNPEKGTLDMITNGIVSEKDYVYFRNVAEQTISITVDLGIVEDIGNIKVWHYYSNGRTYKNILLEVSLDGVKWIKIFDSNENGEYSETAEGKTHKLPTEEELTELNEDATLNDIVTFYEKYLENNKQNKEFLKNVLINKSANVDDNDRMFDLINKVQDIKTGVNVTINDSIKVDYDFNLTLSSVSWVNASTIQRNFYNGSAVIFNNEIHILGGGGQSLKYHKYDGSSWSKASDLPYNFQNGSAVIFNNEIHILGGSNPTYYTHHWKYDGASWTQVSTLPYNFYNGSAVIFNNEIHILGGTNNALKHYKWNGNSWTEVSKLPYNFQNGSAVVLNNEIHILGGDYNTTCYIKHYKWNGNSWTSVSTLPYNFYYGEAVVLNNEIHILGGNGGIDAHRKYNGSSWSNLASIPYSFSSGSAVALNNEIHILGSTYSSSYYTKHYKTKSTYELERL